MAELTEEEKKAAFCAAWCEEHTSSWQILRRGDWTYRWHGQTLVRYVDAVQVRVEEISALLEYLTSDACIATLSLAKQGISGDWKPVNAWYERNEKPNGAIGGVRLYHALMIHPTDGTGDGPYTVEDGCLWNVQWTFYWKQQSVIALPASSSGVNYRITNLVRDDEDGTFSYTLERRERVQQDIAEYETAKTAFEERAEEQHLGVKQERVASTGKQASVSNGKMVERKLRKNDDCTTDVINETTQEVAVSGAVTETESRLRGTVTTTVNRNMQQKASETNLPVGMSVRNEKTPGGRWTQTIREVVGTVAGKLREVCRKTVFRHVHATTTNVQSDPGVQHVSEAGGGVTREIDVQKTENNTFDVTATETTEQAVAGAVTETRKFLDGTVTRTVNRSQASKADESGLGVGDSVRNEQTDGGRWDQTIERASAEPVGTTGEACEQNALVHTHSETRGVGRDRPSASLSAQKGRVLIRRARKTNLGAWEVTDETRTGRPADAYATGGSSSSQTEVWSFRNKSSVATSSPAVNEEVGVTLQRNEFGLLDGTVRTTRHKTRISTAADGSQGQSRVMQSFRNRTSEYSPGAGGVNEEVEVNQSPNELGSFDGTVRMTRFNPSTAVATGGTMLADETRTVTTNNTGKNPTFAPSRGVIYDVLSSPNEHGSATTTVVRKNAIPNIETKTWSEKVENRNGYTTYDNTLIVFRNYQSIPNIPSGGQTTVSFGINDFGLYDGHIHTRVYTGYTDSESGSGGQGTAGSETKEVTIEYNAHVLVGKDKVKILARQIKAKERRFWGTNPIMYVREFNKSASRPDLGLVPHMINLNGISMLVTYDEIRAIGGNGKSWKVSETVTLQEHSGQ